MHDPLLIYGATGFTGRLIVREALARGLRPVLAGRTRGTLEAASRATGLEHRVAALSTGADLSALLAGIHVVLNVAGPFRLTAIVLADACLARGIHYLDVTGECGVIESLAQRDERARALGTMILPSVGFDVVPTDCMAAWVKRALPAASELSIALSGLNALSRGSAATVLDQSDSLVRVRRGGRLIGLPPGTCNDTFDFGMGSRRATAVSWGDVASAYYTTRVPNITVYFEETLPMRVGFALHRSAPWALASPLGVAWQKTVLALLPEGPHSEYRARARAIAIVRARDEAGRRAEVRLETPEVYDFTAVTSLAICERVLAGDWRAGFQTPASVYGPEFVLSLPGVEFRDVS